MEQVQERVESQTKVGWVDLEQVGSSQKPMGEHSAEYLEMQRKLESSNEVFEANAARSDLRLEEQLTAILDDLVSTGEIAGLMIGSDDGLLVAQSNQMKHGETLAAVSSLLEATVSRAQREGIVGRVEEVMLRGCDGEQVALRHFPDIPQFFLIAYAPQKCAYRRITTLALKRCGALLHRVIGSSNAGAAEVPTK